MQAALRLARARSLAPAVRNFSAAAPNKDKVVVTAALNGVLTDPKMFPVPVTPDEMAQAAQEAYDAGATIVHIHFRDERPGKGHLPTWDPKDASDIAAAIRERVPDVMLNFTTGTVGDERMGAMGGGKLGPVGGPLACIEAGKPEIAALNAGSLNYLKVKRNGEWAWPPMMFENSVEKISKMVEGMKAHDVLPECECFDTGIVRSIGMFEKAGIMTAPVHVSLVMGVASGMPCKASWIPMLVAELDETTHWQTIAIGQAEDVWPTLRKSAQLGGNVRTGMEDTFYLPDGSKARNSGELIEALVKICREEGREPANPVETRQLMGMKPL